MSPVLPCFSSATTSPASSNLGCAAPAPATRPGCESSPHRPRRSGSRSPPVTASPWTRSTCGSCGRSAVRCRSTPPDGGTGINNVSVVFLGHVGTRRFLLMGDVEEGIDPSLLTEGLPRVDLLKVAHHGSRTATTQAFVDAVRPARRRRVGRGREPVRASREGHARSPRRIRRPRAPDRPGRLGRGRFRGRWDDRPDRGRALPAPTPRATPAKATTATLATVARTPAFLCAIPVTGLVPDRPAAASAGARRRPPARWRSFTDRRVPSRR